MDLYTKIKESLAGKSSPFAIFDFDNTCIVNDIGEATFAYICRNKLLKDKNLLLSYGGDYDEAVFKEYYRLYKNGRIKEAYILCAKMFSGFTPLEAKLVTNKAIIEEGEKIEGAELYGIPIARGLALRPQVIKLMEFLKEYGVKIWIVSASAEIAVRTLMEYFNINENLIGVRNIEEKGILTNEFEYPLPIIEGKIGCMRTYIDSTNSPLLVIDDSITGLPLLETAEIKVVVDRNNGLAKEARSRDWHILKD